MEKITLEYFRSLTAKQQCDLLNAKSQGQKTLAQMQKEEFNFTNIGQQLKKGATWKSAKKICVYEEPISLSEQEILELKQLLKDKKIMEENKVANEDTVKTRSVLVYQNSYSKFAAWCKENKITQQDALRLATKLLMANYK